MDGIPDEGFAEGDSPDDDAMEINLAAEGDDEVLNGPRATVYYAVPISPTEKEEQGKDFTKEEVAEMMKSEPYQKKLSTCHLCKQCWYDSKFTSQCDECGGYALQRPCPACGGQCGQVWTRDIAKTHSLHKAYWEGQCTLPQPVQDAIMQESKSDHHERTISVGLQGLSTR